MANIDLILDVQLRVTPAEEGDTPAAWACSSAW